MSFKSLVGLLALVMGCGGAHAASAQPQAQQQVAAAPTVETPYTQAQAHPHTRRVPPRLQRFDSNHDGVLEANEVPPRLRAWFANVDANKDGVVTAQEIRAWNRQHRHHAPRSPQQERSASADVHPTELTL